MKNISFIIAYGQVDSSLKATLMGCLQNFIGSDKLKTERQLDTEEKKKQQIKKQVMQQIKSSQARFVSVCIVTTGWK